MNITMYLMRKVNLLEAANIMMKGDVWYGMRINCFVVVYQEHLINCLFE